MTLPVYTPTVWVNGGAPGINGVNLNHIENGIKKVTDSVIDLEEAGSPVPAGLICMWSGDNVPSGWALCDGGGDRPDLRGMFIMGGSLAQIGEKGGSADAVLPSHGHVFTGHELPDHTHKPFNVTGFVSTVAAGSGTSEIINSGQRNTISLEPKALSAGTPSGDNSTEGVSPTGKNLPPYYTLAYIMKV